MNSLWKKDKPSISQMIMWCFILLVLSVATTGVDGQLDSNGFINIDCGLAANSIVIESNMTHLTYISDDKFIDTGANHNISSISSILFKTLRSFPYGTRNCYTLSSLTMMTNYLVRVSFLYGNYDNSNKPPIFDIYLGVNYWQTVNMTAAENDHDILSYEIIATATADYLQVCLVNKGLGTPFISALELRELKRSMYSQANSSQSLQTVSRWNLGRFFDIVIPLIRYSNDPYDRLWTNYTEKTSWKDVYTDNILVPDSDYETPSPVMATAATSSSIHESLDISWTSDDKSIRFMAILHIGEIQFNLSSTDLREFDVIINGILMDHNIVPEKDFSGHVAYALRLDTSYTISLRPTSRSTVPPLLNAFELYVVAPVTGIPTYIGDVTTMNIIKANYRVNKGWSGDPCVPTNLSWTGISCTSDSVNNSPRITSLNLSSSGLTGVVTPSFGNLSALKSLDLSSNNLSGTLPTFLDQLTALTYLDLRGNSKIENTLPPGLQRQVKDGKLTYRFGDINSTPSSSKKSLLVPIVIAGTVGLLIAAAIVTVLLFKRQKYKSLDKPIPNGIPTAEENTPHKVDGRRYGDIHQPNGAGGRHINIENRQFNYSELKTITNNFENNVGTGGFGSVYVGLLENQIQVAVKIRSHESSQGVKEFLAEAQNLSRVHHKNLVSLLGYCMDGDCMALVYEYMPEGTLENKLKDSERTLTWKQRLHIAYESALGLEYLHKACNPPLIHRDVKTGNILLNANLEAKIADFGLSRAFNNNGSSHVSTGIVGTPGYLDPEYYTLYQLSEKSDVFSFGVVLLEIITGQPPIIAGPEGGHVVQWVSRKLSRGDIRSIVDPRMNGQYDINSVWKVTDLARKCTGPTSSERPNMNGVVIELKESLDLEISTEAMRNESTTYTYISQHYYLKNGNFTSDVSQTSLLEVAPIGVRPAPGPI